ncbi:hypothetical protein Kpol_274p3 [Vanderwaltozyma polyspora DSM 70294]|uniref:Uncharacterized protein n=1 Tax=Vanderwaltozyma polyspora (strain ATCC 22028 / DSM 70294 / BCRC 21397 / CBS 2163 / NBRC 10782 / NRRL Y-8283 / UCD 57-17) TaxID=436907 RepID=A7TT84_VANPO|nr:uncharacterized protein Kpol_274p3 [Vanderwaltozyma polyspora DSM 70294]EDO14520.1 hypothetical protein Kpol_274p3 [Vanderwaltozyma polyspora DSM 70294]
MAIVDIGEFTDNFGSLTLRNPNIKDSTLSKKLDILEFGSIPGKENSNTRGSSYSVNSSQMMLSCSNSEEEEDEEDDDNGEEQDKREDIRNIIDTDGNPNGENKSIIEKELELKKFFKSEKNSNPILKTKFTKLRHRDNNINPNFNIITKTLDENESIQGIRNENYHLKLALKEKEDELKNVLKNMKQMNNFETSINPITLNNSNLDKLINIEGENFNKQSLLLNEFDIISHISGSPYKGNRIPSRITESSLASTTISNKINNHQLFTKSIIPFLQKIIQIYNSNFLFEDETDELISKYHDFVDPHLDNNFKVRVLDEMLDELIFLQRQLIGILNRELHYKKITRRLEKSLIDFFDVNSFVSQPPEYVKKLKDDILDTLVQIFGYNIQNIEQYDSYYEKDVFNSYKTSLFTKYSMAADEDENKILIPKTEVQEKLKNIKEGLNLYSKNIFKTKNSSQTDFSSNRSDGSSSSYFGDDLEDSVKDNENIPFKKDTNSNSSSFSGNSCTSIKEKDRLKESKNNLEFYPIGFNEEMLLSKTPQKNMNKTTNNENITPISSLQERIFNDESDALQDFLLEQLDSLEM